LKRGIPKNHDLLHNNYFNDFGGYIPPKIKREEMTMEREKSVTGLSLLFFLVMIACLLGYAQQAGAQQIVYPTNTPADQVNVQLAVNQGGTILLKATALNGTPTPFYFGEPLVWDNAGDLQNSPRRVLILKDVKIFGEKENNGNPLTKISGGVLSFLSPLPALPVSNPGPDITIEGIHFDGAFFAPILIRYARGVKMVGNRITNVHPLATKSTLPDQVNGSPFRLRIQQGISIGSPFQGSYISGILTGIIEVTNNVIDLTINDPYVPPALGIPDHSPKNTFGEGIFVGGTKGASIVILENYVTNCSRNQIEAFDNYLGADGQGFVLVEGNTLITPQDGIAYPSKFCPTGIYVGWAWYPPAANDPTKNPKYTISHNFIENISTRQGIAMGVSSDGAVIQNNEIVVKGNSSNPGSNGLPLNRGIGIVSAYCYVGQNRIEGEGEYGMTFSHINQYQIGSNNVCVGNNINKFNPNEVAAHLYFSSGANNNTVVGGHGTVIDLGANNTFKGGYRDLTGSHITTPGGVGDEISYIKDWWDLPLEERY